MRQVDEKIIFLCDSEPADSPDFSPPGSVYEDEDPEFRAFVEKGIAGTRGPQKDSWGVWVTATEPLRDNQGKIVAFLCADVDAQYWAGRIARFQTLPLLFSLLVSALLILLYVIQQRDQRTRQAMSRMAEEHAFLLDRIETQVWLLKDADTFGPVNLAFAKFCGYPKTSIEHHPLWTVFTSDQELQTQLEANRRVFAEKRPIRSEEWRMSADCHTHLFQVLRAPLLDSRGEVEEVVCCAEDITEVNRAHEALKRTGAGWVLFLTTCPDWPIAAATIGVGRSSLSARVSGSDGLPPRGFFWTRRQNVPGPGCARGADAPVGKRPAGQRGKTPLRSALSACDRLGCAQVGVGARSRRCG
jgi:PAS domain S-box-containing protein